MLYAAENSSVFTCALKVVVVAALFVTGDREFKIGGAETFHNWCHDAECLGLEIEIDSCRRLIE